jgi:hypothetical protein
MAKLCEGTCDLIRDIGAQQPPLLALGERLIDSVRYGDLRAGTVQLFMGVDLRR